MLKPRLIDFSLISPNQLLKFFEHLVDNNLLGAAMTRKLYPDVCANRVMSIQDQLYGSCLVDDNNDIVGIFIGKVVYNWFDTETKGMNELLMFILPEYRKGSNFKRLLRHIENECSKLNVKYLAVGNAIQNDMERFKAIMKHYGFEPDPYFVKEF